MNLDHKIHLYKSLSSPESDVNEVGKEYTIQLFDTYQIQQN